MKNTMEPEILSLLKRAGLNEYESKIYWTLLSNRESSAGSISENAGVPRPRTYDVLEKLAEKGFVAIQPGRPVKYKANHVKEAFSILKNKKHKQFQAHLEEISQIEEKLFEKTKTTKPPELSSEFVWVFKDRTNLHSKIENLFQTAEQNILISADHDSLEHKLSLHENTLRAAKKRGVKIRVVTHSKTHQAAQRAAQFADVTVREHAHRFVIADDNVFLFLNKEQSPEKEAGAWIKSQYLADNLRRLTT